jgi:hypothetical protein
MVPAGNSVWTTTAGDELEVWLSHDPAPEYFIDPKHKILLINWNVKPGGDHPPTRRRCAGGS